MPRYRSSPLGSLIEEALTWQARQVSLLTMTGVTTGVGVVSCTGGAACAGAIDPASPASQSIAPIQRLIPNQPTPLDQRCASIIRYSSPHERYDIPGCLGPVRYGCRSALISRYHSYNLYCHSERKGVDLPHRTPRPEEGVRQGLQTGKRRECCSVCSIA